jgi:hypothetical protein
VVRATRLARAQRREDLLNAAVQLILSGGVEAVSMETVADRAGVSRPLVYRKECGKPCGLIPGMHALCRRATHLYSMRALRLDRSAPLG